MADVVDLCSSDGENNEFISIEEVDSTPVLDNGHPLEWALPKATAKGRRLILGAGNESLTDPIISTSSPNREPRNRPQRNKLSTNSFDASDQDDASDDQLPEPGLAVRKGANFSTTTAAILAEISSQQPTKRARRKKSLNSKRDNDEFDDGVPAAPKKKQRLTSVERELRAAEKETARREKARLREAEKEGRRAEREKELEKRKQGRERQAQEKRKAADLAEVNKSKVDRRITTPEMIVYLPRSIEGKSVDNQLRELLGRANAQVRTYDSPLPGLIKWQQKVTRDFDEELSHWVRADRIDDNKWVLYLLSGERFCQIISGDGQDGDNLETHVAKVKALYPECDLIFLIEGLEVWVRKSRSTQNRAYQAAVRRLEEQEQQTQARRRKQNKVIVDEEAVEDALLELQVAHKFKIQQTLNPTETAEYILSFTQQTSLIRHGYVS